MIATELVDTFVTFLSGLGGTILFLTPGYILGKVYSRSVRAPEREGAAFIASSAIGGLITHLLMSWWTIPLASGLVHDAGDHVGTLSIGHWFEVGAWNIIVLLLVPALLGFVLSLLTEASRPRWWVWLVRRLGLTEVLRTGLAWDWRFSQLSRSGLGAWVRIRLKEDAGTVVGPFGPDSVASSDKSTRDIYLEEVWRVDDEGQPVARTQAGMWIAGDEVLSIEFF
jgi:hypothetical protein